MYEYSTESINVVMYKMDRGIFFQNHLTSERHRAVTANSCLLKVETSGLLIKLSRECDNLLFFIFYFHHI